MYLMTNNGERYEIETFTFPAGEVSVKVPNMRKDSIGIYALIRSSNDVMKLLMVADAIKRECAYNDLYLVLPYVPYARQDRVCNRGEAFSLKVMADLINSCGFDEVLITDPHSDVAPALIDNVTIIEQWEGVAELAHRDKVFKNILTTTEIVSPDAGAEKKTAKLCQKLGKGYYHRGIKHRDLTTGKLSGFDVQFNNPNGDIPESVLIVDDICDGGGTFIGLAKVLKEHGVKTVSLYVTHGVYSRGKKVLLDNGIDFLFEKFDWNRDI